MRWSHVEQAQRRIPVQYAKKMVGSKLMGGASTYIPLKVNMAGVIPVIFASSLLYIPQLLATVSGNTGSGWVCGSSEISRTAPSRSTSCSMSR